MRVCRTFWRMKGIFRGGTDFLERRTSFQNIGSTIALADFNAAHDAAGSLQSQYAAKKVELTGIRGNRDEKVRALSGFVTRFRSTVRGVYGQDSPVYEQAGGTSVSKPKSPARKSKKKAVPAPPPVSPKPQPS